MTRSGVLNRVWDVLSASATDEITQGEFGLAFGDVEDRWKVADPKRIKAEDIDVLSMLIEQAFSLGGNCYEALAAQFGEGVATLVDEIRATAEWAQEVVIAFDPRPLLRFVLSLLRTELVPLLATDV